MDLDIHDRPSRFSVHFTCLTAPVIVFLIVTQLANDDRSLTDLIGKLRARWTSKFFVTGHSPERSCVGRFQRKVLFAVQVAVSNAGSQRPSVRASIWTVKAISCPRSVLCQHRIRTSKSISHCRSAASSEEEQDVRRCGRAAGRRPHWHVMRQPTRHVGALVDAGSSGLPQTPDQDLLFAIKSRTVGTRSTGTFIAVWVVAS